MPLDGSGNFIPLPGAANAAPFTKIKSQTQHNDLWSDAAVAISSKLDADGRKMITGNLTFAATKTVILSKDGVGTEAVRASQLAALSGSLIRNFATRADLVAASVSVELNSVTVEGFYVSNDCVQSLYVRTSAPAIPRTWHVQSADGAWWELRAFPVFARQLGARGNDASDDTIPLQSWADYASAFRVLAQLDMGTFVVPSGTISFGNDVRVTGLRDFSIVKRSTDTVAPLFLASGVDGVSFSDISFISTAGAASSTSHSVTVGSKTFTVPAGLVFANTNSVIILSSAGPSNYMIGTVTSYVGTTMTINVTSAIGSGTFTAWRINRNDGANVACRSINSTNTKMERLKVSGPFYVGIEHQNCDGGIINDCEVSAVINRAIYCYGTSGNTDDVTITNNLLIGGGFSQYAINLNGSIGGTVKNVNISSNRIEGFLFQGIECGGAASDCTISSNLVENFGTGAVGILVQMANGLVPQGIAVTGNAILNCPTGIQLLSALSCTVTGNTVRGGQYGIRLQRISVGTCLNNVVSNNNVSSFTSIGISFESDTPSFTGQGTCGGNVVTGTGGGTFGISSSANTDRITFFGNHCLSSSTNFPTLGTNHAATGNIIA